MNKTQSTISSVSVIFVNLAALAGVAVDQDAVVEVLLAIVMLCSTAWGVWKNHNFTYAAQQGQLVVNQLKGEQNGKHAKNGE